MLALYKSGRKTENVFREALGLTLDDFDEEFMKWVGEMTGNIDLERFRSLLAAGYEHFQKGDYDKAIDVLSTAKDAFPAYAEEDNAYEPLAEAYLKEGNRKAAIETLERFLSYSETSYRAHLKLAQLLEESGDPGGARRILERAIYIHPFDLNGHQKLGGVLLGQKQFAEAAREYEVLLALNAPDRAETYFYLAEAKFGEGKREDARKYILKCLEIAPSYEPAQDLLLKIVR